MQETQEEREQRCHEESHTEYNISDMTETEWLWFHRGIDFGLKWVDNGDKTI